MKDIRDILKNVGFKNTDYAATRVKDYGDGLKIFAVHSDGSEDPDLSGQVVVRLRMTLDDQPLLDITGQVNDEEELTALVKDCCEKAWQKLEKKRKRIEEAQLKTAVLLLSGV